MEGGTPAEKRSQKRPAFIQKRLGPCARITHLAAGINVCLPGRRKQREMGSGITPREGFPCRWIWGRVGWFPYLQAWNGVETSLTQAWTGQARLGSNQGVCFFFQARGSMFVCSSLQLGGPTRGFRGSRDHPPFIWRLRICMESCFQRNLVHQGFQVLSWRRNLC